MLTILASGDLVAGLHEKLLLARADFQLFLTRKTLSLAISRFLRGEIKEEDLVAWANLLEAKDEILYEPGYERVLADVVFQVASPEINAPLVPTTCKALLNVLKGR